MAEQAINVTNASEEAGQMVCYAPTMITTNGIWQGDNPLDYSLPLFILQLTLVVVTTRIFVFLLKPFRQPRVISEILGGLLLGPSVLGRIGVFASTVFPLRSVMVLETMANVGLLYFLFLIGVEMDISVLRRTGKKAMAIAIVGMILPFAIGVAFAFLLTKTDKKLTQSSSILFLGVALSVTAFPVLARILAEIKLINTDLGKLALSAALVNDVCAWVLLAVAIALSENKATIWASLFVILSSVAFMGICIFIVRPLISWMIKRTPEGETFSEFFVCLILTGVMVAGFITDAIGTHSVFGAFVFGLIIPNGPLGVTLVEKLEDFISGLLLPLFFAISGLRTNVTAIGGSTWAMIFVVIILACIGKVVGSVIVALFYQMSLREGITLGLLLNTKGLNELIVLNVGKDQEVLDEGTFAIMVIVALVMTGIITPIVKIIYKPTRKSVSYKRRTIQSSKPNADFRVLVCVHNPRNVPTMISLLEASNPTKRSPLSVFVLHLVELTRRVSAMLIVHNTRKSGRATLNKTQAQSDHIISAFENFEHHIGFVSVQSMTAISPYSTMHEDICSLAEDQCVAFIIIPFHKQQAVDGGMEAINPSFRMINQNVLANASCSVGILIDRGLNNGNRLNSSQVDHSVAVLFFGGPDDREALSYGWRMSEHQGISLHVMRFVPGEEAIGDSWKADGYSNEKDDYTEKQRDAELIHKFRINNANDDSISYTEMVVNNGEETVGAIRSAKGTFDLYIVGRGQAMVSPLTAGLTDWSECPELGGIGDLLASSDFAATISVLVIQQYIGVGLLGDEFGSLDSPIKSNEKICNTKQATPIVNPIRIT